MLLRLDRQHPQRITSQVAHSLTHTHTHTHTHSHTQKRKLTSREGWGGGAERAPRDRPTLRSTSRLRRRPIRCLSYPQLVIVCVCARVHAFVCVCEVWACAGVCACARMYVYVRRPFSALSARRIGGHSFIAAADSHPPVLAESGPAASDPQHSARRGSEHPSCRPARLRPSAADTPIPAVAHATRAPLQPPTLSHSPFPPPPTRLFPLIIPSCAGSRLRGRCLRPTPYFRHSPGRGAGGPQYRLRLIVSARACVCWRARVWKMGGVVYKGWRVYANAHQFQLGQRRLASRKQPRHRHHRFLPVELVARFHLDLSAPEESPQPFRSVEGRDRRRPRQPVHHRVPSRSIEPVSPAAPRCQWHAAIARTHNSGRRVRPKPEGIRRHEAEARRNGLAGGRSSARCDPDSGSLIRDRRRQFIRVLKGSEGRLARVCSDRAEPSPYHGSLVCVCASLCTCAYIITPYSALPASLSLSCTYTILTCLHPSESLSHWRPLAAYKHIAWHTHAQKNNQ